MWRADGRRDEIVHLTPQQANEILARPDGKRCEVQE